MTSLVIGLSMMMSSVAGETSESADCQYSLRDSIAIVAQEYIGTPYLYGGTSSKGFDCSGFVQYVFQQFNVGLPHSSKSMAQLGTERTTDEAKTGDIIVFQGRSSTTVGHVGIVYNNVAEDELIFIHSSSPRSGGVIFSSLDENYYKSRFIKIVDVLSAED